MKQRALITGVVGSLTLLESVIKHRINKIVFSSTGSTYGDPLSIHITEDQNSSISNNLEVVWA